MHGMNTGHQILMHFLLNTRGCRPRGHVGLKRGLFHFRYASCTRPAVRNAPVLNGIMYLLLRCGPRPASVAACIPHFKQHAVTLFTFSTMLGGISQCKKPTMKPCKPLVVGLQAGPPPPLRGTGRGGSGRWSCPPRTRRAADTAAPRRPSAPSTSGHALILDPGWPCASLVLDQCLPLPHNVRLPWVRAAGEAVKVIYLGQWVDAAERSAGVARK